MLLGSQLDNIRSKLIAILLIAMLILSIFIIDLTRIVILEQGDSEKFCRIRNPEPIKPYNTKRNRGIKSLGDSLRSKRWLRVCRWTKWKLRGSCHRQHYK